MKVRSLFVRARALLGLLAIAGCTSASAATFGPPIASSKNLVTRVFAAGDSIAWGVGGTTLSSWMEPLYYSAQSAGMPIFSVGPEVWGFGGLIPFDNHNAAIPGAVVEDNLGFNSILRQEIPHITNEFPEIVILQGGTNDVGEAFRDATTVLGTLSTQLDTTWALGKGNQRFQIIQLTLLQRTDDAGYNATIQTINAGLPAVVAGKSYASHVTLIDIYNTCPYPAFHTTNDKVHPNDAGYTSIAATMWSNGFQTALQRVHF